MSKPPASNLKVVAREPFHIYYEGPARAVSAVNSVGPFDILPGHADFFSVLAPGQVMIETESNPVDFPVSNGIITVRGEEVMLFVNM